MRAFYEVHVGALDAFASDHWCSAQHCMPPLVCIPKVFVAELVCLNIGYDGVMCLSGKDASGITRAEYRRTSVLRGVP